MGKPGKKAGMPAKLKPKKIPVAPAPATQKNIAVLSENVIPLKNGFEIIVIEGKIGDPITRPGLETKYPLPGKADLKGYDRFHLAGPNATGDEKGIVYASKKFNISETAKVENIIREARARVQSAGGGDVYITVKATVKNWKEVDGVTIKILKTIEWNIEARLNGSDTIIPIKNVVAEVQPPIKFPTVFKNFIPDGIGIAGFVAPIIVNKYIHQPAVEQRVEEQVKKEGYVSFDAPSEKGLLYDIAAWFLDPMHDAEYSISIDKRFNVQVWREKIRAIANAKKVGEKLEIEWDVGTCEKDVLRREVIEHRSVIYRKQPDGSFKCESGNNAGTPDINWILNTNTADSEIQNALLSNSCAA